MSSFLTTNQNLNFILAHLIPATFVSIDICQAGLEKFGERLPEPWTKMCKSQRRKLEKPSLYKKYF